MRSLLSTASSSASLLLVAYLSRPITARSELQQQAPVTNGTILWARSSPLLSGFDKRTTCSGTCDECYGTGSILCGDDISCYNPTIGDTCCSEYDYSCSDGYYCAPGGLDSQCCANSLSTSDCTAEIEGGGSSSGGSGDGNGNGNGNGNSNSGSSSGLSTGAKVGIGIGAALLVISIACLILSIVLRSRRRKRIVVTAGPAAWQMPDLSNNQGGPGVTQTGYDNGPQGGFGAPQGAYDPPQGGYAAPSGGGYAGGAPGGYSNVPGGGYSAPPQGGYGNPPQGGYNSGYDNGPQGTYNSNNNNNSTAYNSPQTTYNDTQPAYASTTNYPNTMPTDTKTPAYTTTTTTNTSGGPPVADIYTPASDGAPKSGYGAFVPSHHAELAETPPVHAAHPTQPATYTAPSEIERAGAAEMYGGGYGGQGR